MKKTPVRLKVRPEVIRTLTRRDLTTATGGANPSPDLTKLAGGCVTNGVVAGPMP
jgi:hypothetical protein